MDVAIENALNALKQRRDEIESGIRALEGLNSGNTRTARSAPAIKKAIAKKGRPMTAAIKAKLRAAYAARHPGWKPKKN